MGRWRWLTMMVVVLGCAADDDRANDSTETSGAGSTGQGSSTEPATSGDDRAADESTVDPGTGESTASSVCEPPPSYGLEVTFDGVPPGPDGFPAVSGLPCNITVGAGQFQLALACTGDDGPEMHELSFTADATQDPNGLDGLSAVLDIDSNPEDFPYQLVTLTTPGGELLLAYESGSVYVSQDARDAGLAVETVDRGCAHDPPTGCNSYKPVALMFTLGGDSVELFGGEAAPLGAGFNVLLDEARESNAQGENPCGYAVYRYLIAPQP